MNVAIRTTIILLILAATCAAGVRVEVVEGVPDRKWDFSMAGPPQLTFETRALALAVVPRKYNEKGLIADWTDPFLVRLTGTVTLGPGEHALLLRSLNGARLSIDGLTAVTMRFLDGGGDGHDKVQDAPPPPSPGARVLPIGHVEKRLTLHSDGRAHKFVIEAFIGAKNQRREVGELSLSVRGSDGVYRLIGADVPLTDEGWETYAAEQAMEMARLDGARRNPAGEAAYWDRRHELARAYIVSRPSPDVMNIDDVLVSEDRLADDDSFVRRVFLDTVGVVPSPQEVAAFRADPVETRRARVIDRLLADPRWADHWVSYWQDVLAENPGILKPEMNNTGPFRWWIYESLLDNKPLDRFATELILMEGSVYYGGPAGFSLATQNDVPMAEKAHVIGQAFLAVEMKCARCHDAPYHDVKQRDLFSLAAMLNRGVQKVPATSSIPTQTTATRKLSVEVTLHPGEEVAPVWPFGGGPLEAQWLRNAGPTPDAREQLALLVTRPSNERFAQVAVNRLWARYMGKGIVEPVDDWDGAKPSNPKLLEYLARELVISGYDLKHIARRVLHSKAYQRADPIRRRMTAEQVVDSLHAVAGKPLESEVLTFDPEGRRPTFQFINLGRPKRAWQLTSLSNERDRPALSLPRAQRATDVMRLFGWRESRPSPTSRRDDSPAVQQPAVIANGLLSRRIVRLSEESAFTAMALEAQSPEALVDATFVRVLTRPPTESERAAAVELIREGFADRLVSGAAPAAGRPVSRAGRVSWSNHLDPTASSIMLENEEQVRAGDPPTTRMNPEWRERMEDLVWALVNSPEFVFIP